MDNNWKVSWVNQPFELWTRHVEGYFANCGLFAASLRINDFYDIWWTAHNQEWWAGGDSYWTCYCYG
jgi:hypothetical protein